MKTFLALFFGIVFFADSEPWMIRHNLEGNFTISFPKNWRYCEFGSQRTVIFGPSSNLLDPMVEIDIFNRDISLKKFIKNEHTKIKENNAFFKFEVDFFEKNNRKTYYYQYDCEWSGSSLYMAKKFILINDKIYMITQTCDSEEEEIYFPILLKINDSFESITK